MQEVQFNPWSERSPGGGSGNPLPYSGPGDPMDRGAWRATAHGASRSQARLSTSMDDDAQGLPACSLSALLRRAVASVGQSPSLGKRCDSTHLQGCRRDWATGCLWRGFSLMSLPVPSLCCLLETHACVCLLWLQACLCAGCEQHATSHSHFRAALCHSVLSSHLRGQMLSFPSPSFLSKLCHKYPPHVFLSSLLLSRCNFLIKAEMKKCLAELKCWEWWAYFP